MLLFNRKRLLLVTTFLAAFSTVSPAIGATAEQIYSYAQRRNYNALSHLNGAIDTTDSAGNTALCLAVADDNLSAYNLLLQFGANPQPYCMQAAVQSSNNGTILGLGKVGWTVVGIAAVGGGIAAAAGGGGGGGGGGSSSGGDGGEGGGGDEGGDDTCANDYIARCSSYNGTLQTSATVIEESNCNIPLGWCNTTFYYCRLNTSRCSKGDESDIPAVKPSSRDITDASTTGDITKKITYTNNDANNDNIDMVVNSNRNVTAIYSGQQATANAYSAGAPQQATIAIEQRNSGTVYGIQEKHVGSAGNVGTVSNAAAQSGGQASGEINLLSTYNADVYGISGSENVFNANAQNSGSQATAALTVTNGGDGNIYGLKNTQVDSNEHIANATATDATATANINILNIGNGNVYAIESVNNASNAEASAAQDNTSAQGVISIDSYGNGDIYGIKAQKTVQNAVADLSAPVSTPIAPAQVNAIGKGTANAQIRINNHGTGNSFGIYSPDVIYNATATVSAAALADGQTAEAIGLVSIINQKSGNAYGLYSAGSTGRHTVYNTNSATGKNVSDAGVYSGKATSTVELVNTDNGLAVGIYAADGTIENSGMVKIHNLGDGTAIGIYADGLTNVTNSGTIIIDRADYTDTLTGTVYRATSAVGGKAIGIYGIKGSTIVNEIAGIIKISGATTAYGIFSEGNGVINRGTILIDDKYTENAVRLNGGKLLQDGKLIIDADWSNNGNTGSPVAAGDDDLSGGDVGKVVNDDDRIDYLVDETNITEYANNDNINVTRRSAADVIGMLSAEDNTDNAFARTGSATAAINVEQRGNGDVYGMSASAADAKIYNAKAVTSGNATGTISINNQGSGTVYGMHGNAALTNAYADDNATAKGTINLTNGGNGDIYGLKSASEVGNADSHGRATATGIIRLENNGTGNSYGLWSPSNIYNTRVVDADEQKGYGSGQISIINKATGNAYGMYAATAANHIDNRTSANGKLTSSIEMANVGDGLAVGIYSQDGTVDNSGAITIHNLGNGTAVGIYADGTTAVTNSGTITIDRNAYTDNKTTTDTADDITYTPTTATGGKAIGIYGASGTNINNSGTVIINGADTAYGIFSEGENIVNTGTVLIDGVNNQNAIRVNGGRFFQDGVLIADADWSDNGQDFNDLCRTVTCGANAQCSGGICRCIDNYEGDPDTGCTPIICQNGGTPSGDHCSCPTGWEGTYCETPAACSGYDYTTCPSGYESAATCQSGETTMHQCVVAACDGYQASCASGYHTTDDTCQSGSIIKYKCEINACEDYVTECAEGYHTTSDTCQSGSTTMYKCAADTCPGYVASCNEGYHATEDTCLSGDQLKYKCEADECEGYVNSCPTGYHTTSDTCKSGNRTKYKCETNTCEDYVEECEPGYIPTSATCQAGETIMHKCQINPCNGYVTECEEGYIPTADTCQSGSTTMYKCEVDTCASYSLTQCPQGYKETSSCQYNGVRYVECNDCSEDYVKVGDVCILQKTCAHGTQTATGCSCDAGWEGTYCETPSTCEYTTTACGVGYEETGDTCQSGDVTYVECTPKTCAYTTTECTAGQKPTGNTCRSGDITYVECIADDCTDYPLSAVPENCETYSTCPNDAGKYRCDACNDGYGHDGSGACVQLRSSFIIKSGVKNNSELIANNSLPRSVYGLRKDDATEDFYNAHNYLDAEARIKITNNSEGTSYGIYAANASAHNAYVDTEVTHGLIKLDNSGPGGAAGMYAATGVTNAHTQTGTVYGNIEIDNRGDGNVYGMKNRFTELTGTQTVSDIVGKNAQAAGGTALAAINITNIGNGNVYGIDAGASGINTMSATNGSANGEITINNTGTGNVYGIFARYLAQNATAYQTRAKSEISLTNRGNGGVYGIYSYGYAHNIAGSNYQDRASGATISIDNVGHGKIAAITTADVYNAEAFDREQYYFRTVNSYNLFNAHADNAATEATIDIRDVGNGDITVFDTFIIDATNFPSYSGNIIHNTYAQNNATASSTITIDNIGAIDTLKTIALSRDILNLASAFNHSSAVNEITVNNTGLSQIVISTIEGNSVLRADNSGEIENSITINNDGNGNITLPLLTQATNDSIVNNTYTIDSTGNGNIRAVFTAVTNANAEVNNSINIKQNGSGDIYVQSDIGTNSAATSNIINIEDTAGDVTILTQEDFASATQSEVSKEITLKKNDVGNILLLGKTANEVDEYWLGATDSGTATGQLTLDLTGDNTLQFGAEGHKFYLASGSASSTLNLKRTDNTNALDLALYLSGEATNQIHIDNLNSEDLTFGLYGGAGTSEVVVRNVGNADVTLKNKIDTPLPEMEAAANTYQLVNEGNGAINATLYNATTTIKNIGNGQIHLNGNGGAMTLTSYGNGNIYIAGANDYRLFNESTAHIYDTSTGEVSNIRNRNSRFIQSSNPHVILDHSDTGTANINVVGTIVNRSTGKINSSNRSAHITNLSTGEVSGAYNIANVGDGLAVGIYTSTTLTNNNPITIHNLGDGVAVGLYVDSSVTLTNSAAITIDRNSYTGYELDENGDAVAVTYSAPLQEDEETPTVGGKAIGIYGVAGATIINSGDITINGAQTAYGIYSEGENVTNTGTILIDGETPENAIVLNGGKLLQNGTLKVGADWSSGNSNPYAPTALEDEVTPSYQPASLNLNDFGGTVIASDTSQFIVEGNLSGDLAINNNVITDGFADTYTVENMVQAGSTDGLQLHSQSALFDAALADNRDAVMTMKSFDEVVSNQSLAAFLQENYAAHNNQELFALLKGQETAAALNRTLDGLHSAAMFNRFTFEDLTMLRDLNAEMNNTLFTDNRDRLQIAGSITPWNFDGNSGSNARYALYNNKTGARSLGFGIAFSDVRSHNGKNHRDSRYDQTFQLSIPLGYQRNGFKFVSTPRFGYAYGTYDRTGYAGRNYDGTVEKRMFGLMNEVRYPVALGSWSIAPAAEINALGYHLKGHEDAQEYSLNIRSQNNYSLESGIGLYANRELATGKTGTLQFNAGVAVYHEFADPYEMELGMNGMTGGFNIRDERRKDNRAVIRTGFDYRLGEKLTLIGTVAAYIDGTTHNNANLDFKYNF